MRSEIIITDDFEGLIQQLKDRIQPHLLHIYQREEFKIDDAKEVIEQAYIASEEPKVLALFATRYNIYAQNALLKILEEPPKNVVFILVAKTKSVFLPTILSRLPLRKERSSTQEEAVELEGFDLKALYELVQRHRRVSKSEAKSILRGMLKYAIDEEFPLSQQELDYFGKALELIELNSNPANIFITAGLILLRHKKKKR